MLGSPASRQSKKANENKSFFREINSAQNAGKKIETIQMLLNFDGIKISRPK